MQIILVTQRHGKSVHLPRWLGRSLPYLTLVACAVLFYSGYHYANGQQTSVVSPKAVAQWEREIASQRGDLQDISRRSEEELAALTVRLAELQARSSRLDALGERLVEVAGLDDGEFDFSLPPGVGGPAMMMDVRREDGTLAPGGLRPPS
ncbi:MAG: hypothetical protein WED11_00525, partial [Natronospirillum sp.]